ncbi:MAG TPA: hypothetical protein VG603_04735, partial [Chitinophagales bacterium]|nr:hypothetical protein [Chitinophagales bacterium]
MQQTTATKGIALLCTGHETYMHWAVNMACSLKAVSPNIPIQLVGSGANLEHVRHSGFEKVFDLITPMRWEDYSDAKGSFFPAKAKLMLPGYFDFDTTLYLDVDGVAIKDINPLFEKPDALVMQLNGYYQPGLVEKPANMLWCSSSVIMEHYGIAPGAKIAS